VSSRTEYGTQHWVIAECSCYRSAIVARGRIYCAAESAVPETIGDDGDHDMTGVAGVTVTVRGCKVATDACRKPCATEAHSTSKATHGSKGERYLTADGSNKQQIAQLTIFTLGSNQGTVSMNRRDGSSSGPLQASVFLLPGMFFGGFLMWQRKKLHVRSGQLLMLLILAVSLTGMVGCGNSPLTTTLGSSTVTVTATASAGDRAHRIQAWLLR
jgi:hypothetical protein